MLLVRSGASRGPEPIDELHIDAAAARRVAEAYRRHHGDVFALLLRRTRDRELAAELTNDVFLELILRIDTLDLGESLLPWLVTVANRRAIDERRRRRQRPPTEALESAEVVAAPQRESDQQGVAATIVGAIWALPPTQRYVVVLHLVRGLSFAEIASAPATSEDACRVRFARALRAVQVALAAQGITDASVVSDLRR